MADAKSEPETEDAAVEVTPADRGVMEHGCSHYRRRCKLVAPCCGEVFWCRHCHNQVKNEDEPDPKKTHMLDRSKIAEVVCALCDLRQPVGKECKSCGVQFGCYSCLICNFFDDDLKKLQFHCEDCGLCRVGGREHFFHCNTCGCCYAKSMRQEHKCVADSMRQNCPVCFEFLFDSVKQISVLRCGHTIHADCLNELQARNQIKCPMCSRSIHSPEAMQPLWRSYDEAVATTPMPPEYSNLQVRILCNDCSTHSTTLFHVVGHKCGSCGGYNTQRT